MEEANNCPLVTVTQDDKRHIRRLLNGSVQTQHDMDDLWKTAAMLAEDVGLFSPERDEVAIRLAMRTSERMGAEKGIRYLQSQTGRNWGNKLRLFPSFQFG